MILLYLGRLRLVECKQGLTAANVHWLASERAGNESADDCDALNASLKIESSKSAVPAARSNGPADWNVFADRMPGQDYVQQGIDLASSLFADPVSTRDRSLTSNLQRPESHVCLLFLCLIDPWERPSRSFVGF